MLGIYHYFIPYDKDLFWRKRAMKRDELIKEKEKEKKGIKNFLFFIKINYVK
jgi:hypothetical protein